MVTMVFNVPRNDALAATEPTSVEGASLWSNYITTWTAWNHVRTVAALAAAALSPLPPASEGERDDKGTHNRPERLIKPKGFF